MSGDPDPGDPGGLDDPDDPGGGREPSDRRTLIIAAATDVFARRGYAGASLRELAAGAGMEKGHLTYYFPNKESLLFEIVEHLHRRFVEGIDRWADEEPPGDELLGHVFREHLVLVIEAVAAARVAYDNFRFLSGERRQQIVELRRDYEVRLGTIIDRCRAVTSIAETPTEILTKVLLGQLNWPYQWYSPTGRRDVEDLAGLLAERALASLRPVEL